MFFSFLFGSLFNVRAMPNRCCDGLEKKHPDSERESDFGSDRDSNCWPAPSHDFSSGRDSVYHLSAIPYVSFRPNSFTIRRPSPMLVWKMPTPGHGDSNSSRISPSTRLPQISPDWECSILTGQYRKYVRISLLPRVIEGIFLVLSRCTFCILQQAWVPTILLGCMRQEDCRWEEKQFIRVFVFLCSCANQTRDSIVWKMNL